jgi:cephalosporin hydroxylase
MINSIKIDMESGVVKVGPDNSEVSLPIGSPEAFKLISQAWLRSGWDNKYVYSFTWLGRPIIQLPEDILRIQEVIYRVKPSIIIETGVAHGGSLVFYASLCNAMGSGRILGVDIEIRPHNRKAIEEHELARFITLIEGSSISDEVLEEVRGHISPSDRVLVILDSNHSKAHVLAELEAYSPLVTQGSYIVATDGIMHWLGDAPRTNPDWFWNNPKNAAEEFVKTHPEFRSEAPDFLFNEGNIKEMVSYWPGAWLRRS